MSTNIRKRLNYQKLSLLHLKQQYNCHVYQNEQTYFGWLDSFDQQGNVIDATNRAYYQSLSQLFPELSFFSVEQVHQDQIISTTPDINCQFTRLGKADGIISDQDRQALTIRTADCVPLYLWNRQQTAIIHAGYRSILSGILSNFLHRYRRNELDWNMAIGPHIRSCCFEVKNDVISQFERFHHFKPHDIIRFDNKTRINLAAIVSRIFLKAGYPENQLYDLSLCSCCNREYHSYRRNKTKFRIGHLIFKRSWNYEIGR